MRILFLDIDTLRPDHLGCYGYHRNTSPNIDRLAAEGVRCENYHVSDAPCLPSRAAMWSGRFGIHTGVVNHGGAQADPFIEGAGRGFQSTWGRDNWIACLVRARFDKGFKAAAISPFGERHSAFWWYANYNEVYNTGGCGGERADQITPVALDWIKRNAKRDEWFLHVNLWDPHTAYRTPAEFGDPFKDEPLPEWLTDEVRAQHFTLPGPHSCQEPHGYKIDPKLGERFPRHHGSATDMQQVRKMFDGYDTGIRYADEHIGQMLNALADEGVLDDTMIFVSSDHGENLGELNVYGDHQTADQITSRVPLIARFPGITDDQAGRVDQALHYNADFSATLIELAGGTVPDSWDGRSFAPAFKAGQEDGREYLVLSQNAWSCQRAVRWENYICTRVYHDGYHGYGEVMLFDLATDPHEQHDLAAERPDLVGRAMTMLDEWTAEMMRTATEPRDPMWQVLAEGGPLHTRGQLPEYLKHLRATDRARWADHLAARHPNEC